MEKTLSRFSQKTQINFMKLKVLVQEQENIPCYVLSDMQILRFLIFADKDINKALEKIKLHMKWRQDNEELFEQAKSCGLQIQNELRAKGFIMCYYGVTKKGRPLRINIMSDGDYMEVQQKYEKDIAAYNIAFMERLVNIIFPSVREKYGEDPDGSISIIDVQNLKFGNFIKNIRAQKQFKKISNSIMENYPLTGLRTYIINSGTFFTALWTLIKSLLSEKITKKVVILNEDYLPEILKEIDIDQLPECLGGKCKYKLGEYPNLWDEQYHKSIQQKDLGEEYRKKIENKFKQVQSVYQ